MERSIQAPEKDWLTSEEAAVWLNIPHATFLALDRRGVVPGGRKFGPKTKRWHWKGLVALSIQTELGHLPEVEEEEK
jgi:hypothetical protein